MGWGGEGVTGEASPLDGAGGGGLVVAKGKGAVLGPHPVPIS